MKSLLAICALAILLILVGSQFPRMVRAQSFGGFSVGPMPPTVAGCPLGVPQQAVYCPVGTAAPYATYVSYNAQPYILLIAPPAAVGVTGFGNPPRTGNVVLTKTDITQTGVVASVPASSAPLQ